LWPLILVLVKTFKNKNILLICSLPIIPFIRTFYYHTTHSSLYYSFPVRGDAIMLGCFLALNRATIDKVFNNHMQLRFVILLVAGLVYTVNVLAAKQKSGIVTVPINILLYAVFSALLIIAYAIISNTKSLVYKVLNNKAICFFGILSYSLYIWQLFYLQKVETGSLNWKYYTINILLAFITVNCSYYILENPFLHLRK
jgi:peptidoglycan/LPS O-acetylase OafA/YrhL